MKTLKDKIDLDPGEFSEEVVSLLPDLVSSQTTKRKSAREKLSGIAPMVLDELSKLCESGNKQLRWEVAKSLETRHSVGSIPVLLKLLADEESDIRWLAAEGMINVGRRALVPLLHEIIYNESSYLFDSAHHVFNELLTRKEKRSYQPLMKALKHSTNVKGIASLKAKQILDSQYSD